MRRRLFFALLAAIPAAARAQPVNPTGPQPELPKEKLAIVTRDGVRHDFNVEMATAPDQQTVGLMFRPSVPADGGMLFDWRTARQSQMWMRNTIASLDMVFINADGTIRSIAENTVPESLAVIDSRGAGARHAGACRGHCRQAEHQGGGQGPAADLRQRPGLRRRRPIAACLSVRRSIGSPGFSRRGVAQPGQRACFGYTRSWVQIPPPRPVYCGSCRALEPIPPGIPPWNSPRNSHWAGRSVRRPSPP